MEVIALGPDAGTAVARTLQANSVVCLMADRDITGDGVEVEFFGERTTLPAGPALLALRSGAPLIPMAVYFRPHGHHLARIGPPVPVGAGGPPARRHRSHHAGRRASLRGVHPRRADPVARDATELAERPGAAPHESGA